MSMLVHVRRLSRSVTVLSVLVASGLVGGCRVENHKNGNSDDVKIATPFGGLSVKTNNAAVLEGTGLPPYPGAEVVKKGKDNGAADVNMSFGSFQLRVKAVSYRTSDPPDKVLSFYRNALHRYGDVIQCASNRPVGTPIRTAEGLTCDPGKDHHISVSDDVSGKMELKAGSKQHQHIVEVDPEGNGTKFGLVVLDLPRHITADENDKD